MAENDRKLNCQIFSDPWNIKIVFSRYLSIMCFIIAYISVINNRTLSMICALTKNTVANT